MHVDGEPCLRGVQGGERGGAGRVGGRAVSRLHQRKHLDARPADPRDEVLLRQDADDHLRCRGPGRRRQQGRGRQHQGRYDHGRQADDRWAVSTHPDILPRRSSLSAGVPSVRMRSPPGGSRMNDDGALSATARRLESRLRSQVGKAIEDYGMIADGDRVMVCLSGGKDSYALLSLLIALQRAAPVSFELVAVNLDQKQPGFPAHVLPEYLAALGVPFHILEQDTYSVVKRVIPEGKTTCGLCSRLRRGALYSFAAAQGFNKIALGHHRDDIIETLFLNLFFGGTIKAMPPKLRSDDGRNVVIWPLAYCRENELARYATAKQFPLIPCNLCGAQENLQRQEIKAMLADWERRFPGRIDSIAAALANVAPSQLLDTQLFDFAGLATQNRAAAD